MGKQYLNGVLYGTGEIIKFSPYIYSLEEREVGVFTDGKPLYQKSGYIPYSHFVTDGYQKRVDIASELSLSNIDIKNYDGYLSSPNFGKCTIGSIMYRGNQDLTHLESAFYYGLLVLRSYYNGSIVTNPDNASAAGVAYYAPDLYVTIQYTKTTDTPGSGHYTTNGGETHHYSLTEQVIGTWVDNKPIYEKSYLVDWQPTVVDTIIDNTINTSNIALRSLIGTWSVGNYGYPTAYQVDIHDDCYFGSSNVWVSKPKIFLSDNGLTIRRTQSTYGAWYTITIQYTKTTD